MALSYEDRVGKMKTVADVGDQLRKAVNAEKKAKAAVRTAGNFSKKIELQRELKEASTVVRKLRSNLFDLEDEISLRIEQEAQAQADTEARKQKAVEDKINGSIQSNGLFAF